jgi:hypothetical protein
MDKAFCVRSAALHSEPNFFNETLADHFSTNNQLKLIKIFKSGITGAVLLWAIFKVAAALITAFISGRF